MVCLWKKLHLNIIAKFDFYSRTRKNQTQRLSIFFSLMLWLSFFWRSFCKARRSSSDNGSSLTEIWKSLVFKRSCLWNITSDHSVVMKHLTSDTCNAACLKWSLTLRMEIFNFFFVFSSAGRPKTILPQTYTDCLIEFAPGEKNNRQLKTRLFGFCLFYFLTLSMLSLSLQLDGAFPSWLKKSKSVFAFTWNRIDSILFQITLLQLKGKSSQKTLNMTM